MQVELSTLIGGGTAGIALYGVAVIVKAVLGRRVPNAEAAKILSESATKLVEEARDDARQEVDRARKEVTEARQEAEAARRAAVAAERSAEESRRASEDLAYNMRRLVRVIMHPASTLESVREMVKTYDSWTNPARNGHPFGESP